MIGLLRACLIGVACTGLAIGCNHVAACSAEVKKEVASRDGRWNAVVFKRSCGSLSSPQTGVSILEQSQAVGKEYPNVFSITYSGYLRPDEIGAVLDSVSVKWTSDSTISIEYDARAMILYQVTRLWGLFVTYTETSTPEKASPVKQRG